MSNKSLPPFEKASLDILILETIQKADAICGSYNNRSGLAYLIDTLPDMARKYHHEVVEIWEKQIAENEKSLKID
ncbi:hypothetical protein IR083_23015 [Dysgonomonas sp. GY75]|uniref:hypothetical protein n=1 Tax=Dysgonomonas sp. GY75 TaxID=2780419 RepID=UPI0018843E54|nr:hypothetical protein [Dysgonomonas sp. GY75]MBF0651693.1 hypothetical protein [Dysgonomonas sp. GY75]